MQYTEHPVGRRLIWSGIALMCLCSIWIGDLKAAEPDYMAALGVVRFDGNIDAPDFTLPTVDGHQTRLQSLRGKVIILNFWATW